MATTVNPITRSLTPRSVAMSLAELTSACEPKTSNTRPSTRKPMSDRTDALANASGSSASSYSVTMSGADPRVAVITVQVRYTASKSRNTTPSTRLERLVQHEHEQQHRCADHDRHVETHDALSDEQRTADGRGRAEHEQDVGDVRPDDVADGDRPGLRTAAQRVADADGELGCARAEGDDGQPDDDARHAGSGGQSGLRRGRGTRPRRRARRVRRSGSQSRSGPSRPAGYDRTPNVTRCGPQVALRPAGERVRPGTKRHGAA